MCNQCLGSWRSHQLCAFTRLSCTEQCCCTLGAVHAITPCLCGRARRSCGRCASRMWTRPRCAWCCSTATAAWASCRARMRPCWPCSARRTSTTSRTSWTNAWTRWVPLPAVTTSRRCCRRAEFCTLSHGQPQASQKVECKLALPCSTSSQNPTPDAGELVCRVAGACAQRGALLLSPGAA